MKKPAKEELLELVESALDALLENAHQINLNTQQVISEDELILMQKKQEKLVANLEKFNRELEKNYHQEIAHPATIRIKEKLALFQKLNNEFIETITNSKGLIHFDDSKIRLHQKITKTEN